LIYLIFDTSEVTDMSSMFYDCENLEFINLKNFKENNLNYVGLFLNNVPDYIVVCINKDNIQNKIFPKIKEKKCYVEDCSENWKSKQKK